MDINDKWFVCIKAIPQKDGGIMPLIAEDELVTLNKIKAYCKDELTVDFFAEHFRPAKDNEIPIVLTDFERMLDATAYGLQNSKDSERKQTIRKHSDILIKLARKEIEKKPERKFHDDFSDFWLQKDIDDIIKKTEEGTEKIKKYFSNLIVHDNIRFNYPELYDEVKKEVLRDLPHWELAPSGSQTITPTSVFLEYPVIDTDYVDADIYLRKGAWHISVKALENLPKEE